MKLTEMFVHFAVT